MLKTFLSLLLLLAAPQADVFKVFKKEMAPLQSAVDTVVTSTGSQVLQRSRAAYVEGYGIVVTLEVAFETPQNIFSSPKSSAEVRSLVAQRRKDVQEKVTALVKQRVATTDSMGPMDSLAIVIHVLNTNPADIPNLPVQILMIAKKESPQQVAYREF